MEEGHIVTITTQPAMEMVAVNLGPAAPLTPEQQVDFGITTESHSQALKAAINAAFGDLGADAALEQLDGVLGNGPATTAFVHKYAPHWRHITFSTRYDALLEREDHAHQ